MKKLHGNTGLKRSKEHIQKLQQGLIAFWSNPENKKRTGKKIQAYHALRRLRLQIPTKCCVCQKNLLVLPSENSSTIVCSPECRKIRRLRWYQSSSGANSWKWRGDKACYLTRHVYVNRKRGKPTHCEYCGKTTGYLEWSSLDHSYLRDPGHYIGVCKPCHIKHDLQLGLHVIKELVGKSRNYLITY